MRPKVSVIIPVYNTAKYLERCMKSVMGQTLKEIEIILVDDGSTDNSPAMCDAFVQMDSRVKVIHKINQGLGFARNSGMESATGEYVAFLDSDDYVSVSFYKNLYEDATKMGADACIGGFISKYNNGREEIHRNPQAGCMREGTAVRTAILPDILGAPPQASDDVVMGMAVWKNLFRLDMILQNKLSFCSEREFISEDAIFDIDFFARAPKVIISEESGYYYCENGVSLSRKYQPNRFERCEVLYQEEIRRIQELNMENITALKLAVQRSFIGNARYCMQQVFHNLNMTQAIGKINEICKSDLLQGVLEEYPYKENPLKLRIFNILIQKKCGWLLWFLIRLKG